jgi:uncharacterized membrane protein YdjX (TVP38/TMEM64 family)
MGMTRYWLLVGGLLAVLLALFFAAEAARVPLLIDPRPWLGAATPWVATTGVALLLLDVMLPVPSSLVMTLNGALFGVTGGALLSMIGGVGAALFGFGLGRLGEPMLQRLLRPTERERAARMLARWGPLAILLSRPVPLLAETVAILAGASPVRWHAATTAAIAGTLPVAFAYAWLGAGAARAHHFVLGFIVIMIVTGALAWAARSGISRRDPQAQTHG